MMKPESHRLIFALAIGLTLLLAAEHPAASAPQRQVAAVTLFAEAGYDGYIKTDTWIPLRITLSSLTAVDGEIVVTTADNSMRYATPVSLSPGVRRQYTLYAPPTNQPLEAQFITANNTVAGRIMPPLRTLSRLDRMILVIAEPPDSFNFLSDLPTPFDGRSFLAESLIEQLPDHLATLGSLDVVIFSNVDTASLSQAQREALRAWVTNGGHVIVNGGPGATLASGGLGDLSPARVSSVLLNTPATALSDFVRPDAVQPWEELPAGLFAQAVTLVPAAADARTLLASRDTPLIVRRDLGRGLVDQLAFDPTLSPLRDWAHRDMLFTTLFDGRVDIPNNISDIREDDAAASAARALPTAALPSVIVVGGFLAVYVLCVGPVNFWLLRRIRRRELAWITTPSLVIAFTALGLIAGFRLRGNEPQMHRLSAMTGDARIDGGQTQSLIGLFAPRRSIQSMTIGRGLAREINQDAQIAERVTLRVGEPNRLENVAVGNDAMRMFFVRTQGSLPAIQTDLMLMPWRTPDEPARITGEIINESDAPYTGCVLIVGHDYQAVGDIPARGAAQVSVAMVFNRPQSAVNLNRAEISGAAYPSAAGLSRRTSLSSSRAPAVYREPFDLPGATLLDAIIGWRTYADETHAIAESNLVAAVYGNAGSRIGIGVNLACWEAADRSSIAIEGGAYTDRGLRVWRVPVKPYLFDASTYLPPDIFVWTMRATSSSARFATGGLNLAPGQHVFGFSPWLDLRATGPATATIEYAFSTGTRLAELRGTDVWLYDWGNQQYDQILSDPGTTNASVTVFGDYVSPAGDVRVRIDNPNGQVVLSNLQVSLKTP